MSCQSGSTHKRRGCVETFSIIESKKPEPIDNRRNNSLKNFVNLTKSIGIDFKQN